MVTIQKAVYDSAAGKWVFSDPDENGVLSFTGGSVILAEDEDGNLSLNIQNTPLNSVQVLKKSYTGNIVLTGVEFSLYELSQLGTDNLPKEGEIPILSGATNENGILNLGVLKANHTYSLFETKTLDGYNLLTSLKGKREETLLRIPDRETALSYRRKNENEGRSMIRSPPFVLRFPDFLDAGASISSARSASFRSSAEPFGKSRTALDGRGASWYNN